ncbi:MAG: PEP-CTERM sorting domain-containing protein [Microcoleus sp.]
MNNQILNKILGAIGTIALAIVAGLAAETPKAQAAVLSYNFTTDTTGWTTGTYSGFFKFDNSSLTGIGEEVVGISEAVFNFVDAENKPRTYNFGSSSKVSFGINNVYRDIFITSSAIDIAVYLLDGELLGLSFGRFALSSISGAPRFIDEGLRQFTTSDVLYMTIDPYTDVIDGYLRMPLNRLASIDLPYQGTVNYTGPDRAVDVPCATVPEPMTVAGTALALASCAAFKRKKNQQHLS